MPKSSFERFFGLDLSRGRSGLDWAELQAQLRRQFVNLDPNDPSRWPALPRVLLLMMAGVVVFAALWYVWLADVGTELENARRREAELKQQYTEKVAKASSLDYYKIQLEQVRQFVVQLERQLPSRSEMDALLSDINQAGVGRGLQFELFRPGQETMRDHYVELPVTLRLTGSFDQIGQFVADIAHLSRIVTLGDISIAPAPNRGDQLTMEAIAKTYRYLDPEERLGQKRRTRNAEGGES